MHLFSCGPSGLFTDLQRDNLWIVLVSKGEAVLPWQIMKAEERDRKVLRSSIRSTTLYQTVGPYMPEGSNFYTV
jgi:hypothetical protein